MCSIFFKNLKERQYTKKQFALIGVFLLVFVSLSGCTENSNKTDIKTKFIGTWEGISQSNGASRNVTLIFYKDDTAKQVSDDFHAHLFFYELDDNSVYFTLQDFPDIDPLIYSYKFSNNYNDLTLTNATFDTLILSKQ